MNDREALTFLARMRAAWPYFCANDDAQTELWLGYLRKLDGSVAGPVVDRLIAGSERAPSVAEFQFACRQQWTNTPTDMRALEEARPARTVADAGIAACRDALAQVKPPKGSRRLPRKDVA